jgi:hypothetical protein
MDEGMKFSDSEDERGVGLDDGFMEDEQNDNDVQQNMSLILSTIGCNDNDFDDKGYESEELGSSDPDASDDDRGPIYEKFRKEHLNANFKFKFGMEFNSMQDFRDAMREWSALNGQPLDWVKNERTRVRVVCERKCGFFALCSQVGQEMTYVIKTPTKKMVHTCLTVSNNKTANSKWVAKEVVKLMQTFQKVILKDIMQHMRTNFSLGISMSRAWKAK